MSPRVSVSKTVDAVSRVCDRAADADELFEGLSHEVGKAIPFDSAVWLGFDPATLLAVAPARVEYMDHGYCTTMWHGEFHDQDVLLFRDLALAPVPAGTLRSATGNRPLRSHRFRNFMQPQGWDDELRVVFRIGEKAWGGAALYRDAEHPAFDDDDVALVTAISSVVATSVRMQIAASSLPTTTALTTAPGLLLFDGDGVLMSANAEAARWLHDLYGPNADPAASWVHTLADPEAVDVETPVPIIPLLARARAIAVGREDGQARLRLRDRNGRWVVLHASCLDGRDAHGTVAVVVEPAKSAEIAPIVIDAYGLTARERDVVRAIAQGLSTPAIAEQLYLSPHTVRDYIKSVFEKVGVTSRGELVAKFFAEHYSDPMHDAIVAVD